MIQDTRNLVERQIFSDIASHMQAKEITLIIGPRQVGKTTLLLQLREYLVSKGYSDKRILTFNLDIISERRLFESQKDFITFLKERVGKDKLFVFVDEAQRVENAGIFFKGIYDLDLPVKFVLTGSSALEIKAKIHEPLTGRKRLFYLYPLSFAEYLSAKGNFTQGSRESSNYTKELIFEDLSRFLVWGGYPKIVLEENVWEKQQFLKEIYSSYIEKDIIGFLQIRNFTAFSNLVSILSSQIGQLVNTEELSNSLKMERRTVEKYIEVLEKTFILKRVSPFFRNIRKELTKMPKIYFLDTGIRNFALDAFKNFQERQDKGALMENFIFSELAKQIDARIHFWRTKEKAEIDFVLTTPRGGALPIEVKAVAMKSPEISRSFHSFLKHYQPPSACIINMGFQGRIKTGDTQVDFLYPYEIARIIDKYNEL